MRIAVLDKGEGPAYFRLDDDSSATPFTAPPYAGGVPDERAPKVSYTPSDLRAPVRPTKVLCVGRNYAAHAKELGNEVPKEPLLFLKPPTAVIGPEGVVILPPESERVEHEVELAVVVGKRATRVSREEALAHVLGYTVACDVTARDLQRKDVQFTRAKGFDTFCPRRP